MDSIRMWISMRCLHQVFYNLFHPHPSPLPKGLKKDWKKFQAGSFPSPCPLPKGEGSHQEKGTGSITL
jgi:hypothetical protein